MAAQDARRGRARRTRSSRPGSLADVLDMAKPAHHEPDDAATAPEDHLEAQRWRDYRRGRRYEVLVPSPFARNPRYQGEPVLRTRVCADPGDLLEGGTREPVFVTEDEWMELRIAEQSAELRTEGYRAPEQWMTLAEIAAEVGKSERTIRRHIVERGECQFTTFGRTKKVRRSDFEEWCKKDLPVTKEIREVDAFRREDF